MNRRTFLKIFGASTGAALAASIIPPVAHKALLDTDDPDFMYSVRYIKAFDINRGELVGRLDIARGFKIVVPKCVDCGYVIHGLKENQVMDGIDVLRKKYPSIPSREVVANILRSAPKEHNYLSIEIGHA